MNRFHSSSLQTSASLKHIEYVYTKRCLCAKDVCVPKDLKNGNNLQTLVYVCMCIFHWREENACFLQQLNAKHILPCLPPILFTKLKSVQPALWSILASSLLHRQTALNNQANQIGKSTRRVFGQWIFWLRSKGGTL